jgi:alcohol dehydrogenase
MKTRAAVLSSMGTPGPYENSKPLVIEELELDLPGPGEVLVRVKAAGLCHSDLSVINGDRPRPLPMALGHEAAGIVEEVGPGVADLSRGDPVVCVFVPSCGHCGPCAEGRPPCVSRGGRERAGTLLRCTPAAPADGTPVQHHLRLASPNTPRSRATVGEDRSGAAVTTGIAGCAVLTASVPWSTPRGCRLAPRPR